MARKKTHEEFVQEINELFGDEYEIIGNYINSTTPIKIMHKKCNYEFFRKPNNLLGRKNCFCPMCNPDKFTNIVIPGVNDIYTTNKKLYFLLDDKDDGLKYRENSNKKTYFRCPNCNNKIFATIGNVNIQGLSCPCCGDGYSYPEKFMYNVLMQLHIPFDYQWNPDWLKPYYYDFHFIINNIEYVIEMDGELGHGHNDFLNDSDTNGLQRDIIKDRLAHEHNIVVIRIDCVYRGYKNRFSHIKENIITSLNQIVNTDNINFEECDNMAKTSIIKEISNLWNNGIYGYQNIQEYYKLNRSTIRYYLKTASNLGLISDTYEEILKINRRYSNIQLAKTKGNAVKCNQTNEVFYSYASAKRKYGVDLSYYFNTKSNSKYCGTLPDGTRLTWTKL